VKTSDEIVIRPFALADLAQVAAIEDSVYASAGYRTIMFRQLHDLAPSLLWVAEDGGRVVGHLCCAIAASGSPGWILNLAVLAHYRRQGIGLRLLEKGIEQLCAAGVDRIMVTAETENNTAQRLYFRLGFELVGTGVNYYGNGQDRAIFEYRIKE
jgi:ribosomal protein S18 acetylase RimI-like enzyme